MSLYPCSCCGSRPQGKLSSVTWAWNRADGTRVAFRQRLCLSCFTLYVQGLPMLPPDSEIVCPRCGIGTEHDMDPVYATAFVPTIGRYDFEWATCASCAVEIRNAAEVGAEKLEDRQQGSLGAGASGPQTIAAAQTWASLGRAPLP